MISIFGDGLAGCLVCGFLFGLGVVFCCLVCFPHGRDLLFLLNCVRIVCNLERPSELSWRARHGREKKSREEDILNNGLGKVCEQRVEDVPGMGLFFLQVTATSNHMGNHMPTLHEGLKGTSPSEGFKGA